MILVCYVALTLFNVGSVCGQSANVSINEFNIDELDLYNSMVSCVSNFKDQFAVCNNDIKHLAKQLFSVINENSTLGGVVKCCGIWMARDCWISHARRNCPSEKVADISLLPFKLLPKLDLWCQVYHDQTIACLLLSHSLVVSICFAITFVILIALCIVAFKLKYLQKNKPKTFSPKCDTQTDNNNAVSQNLLDRNKNVQII